LAGPPALAAGLPPGNRPGERRSVRGARLRPRPHRADRRPRHRGRRGGDRRRPPDAFRLGALCRNALPRAAGGAPLSRSPPAADPAGPRRCRPAPPTAPRGP
jgi:hypothetical protein